ncbi:MAG: glycerol kinase GlpK [Stappiaceae bacterium]
MTDKSLILAIDQGTTSTRSIVFDGNFRSVGSSQEEFEQHFPDSGWVEHEPDDLWQTTVRTARGALTNAGVSAAEIAAIGITNQRETTIVWDRETGEAIHRAIVWQDRRTSAYCLKLREDGHEELFAEKTGLLLDPYFSATKVHWLLENVDGAQERAEAGKLLFGTVDCWLVWKLTGGRVHATDATNAARTMLYNIHEGCWDTELLKLLNIPASMLPEVKDCAADFGQTDEDILGASLPIAGIAGDQQAATVGQACFEPGMFKSTYGTGCFALLNTGEKPVRSTNRLLTTIAYQLDGKPVYALEGAIFIAGAAVQWLRDGLGIIDHAAQSGELAAEADPTQDVYLVPAFTGLGAPWWDADARGAIFGLTRSSGPNELSRAALEAVCYQTLDLLNAMQDDWAASPDTVLRVDGGMVASDWAMQRLSDILDAPVDRPVILETTALGAAWLAGYKVGVWPDMDGFAESWKRERRFEPAMAPDIRAKKLAGWRDAVRRVLTAYHTE